MRGAIASGFAWGLCDSLTRKEELAATQSQLSQPTSSAPRPLIGISAARRTLTT